MCVVRILLLYNMLAPLQLEAMRLMCNCVIALTGCLYMSQDREVASACSRELRLSKDEMSICRLKLALTVNAVKLDVNLLFLQSPACSREQKVSCLTHPRRLMTYPAHLSQACSLNTNEIIAAVVAAMTIAML